MNKFGNKKTPEGVLRKLMSDIGEIHFCKRVQILVTDLNDGRENSPISGDFTRKVLSDIFYIMRLFRLYRFVNIY